MKRIKLSLFYFALLFSISFSAENSFARSSEIAISTRPGVTVDFLILSPEKKIDSLDAIIIFTGGNGAIPFRMTDSGAVAGWNFLTRSSDYFLNQGITVVTPKPPSDHKTGISPEFRESAEHSRDIQSIVKYLKSIGFKRIFVAGNSRGTLSAASVASRLNSTELNGLILTSTLERDFFEPIEIKNVNKPVLMVHHRYDRCRVTPFDEALKIRDDMAKSTKVDFVEVSNSGFYTMSPPCDDLSSHGFFGVEEKVAKVISDWIYGKRIPEIIE